MRHAPDDGVRKDQARWNSGGAAICQRQRHGRQDQGPQRSNRVGPARKPSRREPAQVHRKKQHQENGQPECRNCDAKLAQEHLCNAYVREHPGSTCTSLRYHNVYGPRMPRDTPYAGVASIFRSAYERGIAPKVFEDGGQRRDFIHVADIAHCNVLALTNRKAAQGAFNVCTGVPKTILDMAQALRSDDAPEPEVVGGHRLGDIRHIFASPARARDELGFTAAVSFEAGMREFAQAPLRQTVGPRPHIG